MTAEQAYNTAQNALKESSNYDYYIAQVIETIKPPKCGTKVTIEGIISDQDKRKLEENGFKVNSQFIPYKQEYYITIDWSKEAQEKTDIDDLKQAYISNK